jgi:hypothetical protein
VPTIYHQARCLMMGTLSLYPPDSALRADLLRASSAISGGRLRHFNPTGKSVKPVQPPLQKYSA